MHTCRRASFGRNPSLTSQYHALFLTLWQARKALAAFVLIAPCLTRERCTEVELLGGGAPYELQRGGDVEAIWSQARFSAPVNAAKRAFINRLGSDLAVVCG